MKAVTIHSYIYLGALYWHLTKLSGTPEAKGEKGVLTAILNLKQKIEEAGLPVTLRAGNKLWTIAGEIEKDENLNTLPIEMTRKISGLAQTLESTLIAEAEGKVIYQITDKRIDLDKLLYKQSALLAPNVFMSIPLICASDFNEACKSIAYELTTGGAFYILRCTEGVIRHYYLGVIKRKRLKSNYRTWGRMIEQMRNKRTNKPPVEILDTIDSIGVNFRNQTNHPDKVYDIEEVQDLFGLCVEVINRIVNAGQWELPEDSLEKFRQEYQKKSKQEEDEED